MAEKNLGVKEKDFYNGPEIVKTENTVRYPDMDLPLDFVDGMDLSVDDEVTLAFKGRVSGLQDTKWSKRVTFELHTGEATKKKEEKKD